MRRVRLPLVVEKGKIYPLERYNPHKLKWERIYVEVVDIFENKTPDGKPGAQIIVCRSVKKL